MSKFYLGGMTHKENPIKNLKVLFGLVYTTGRKGQTLIFRVFCLRKSLIIVKLFHRSHDTQAQNS